MQDCIANIGPRERRRRLAWGSGTLAVAVVLAVVLAAAPVWQRALIWAPLVIAGYGIFQYLEKT